MLFVLCLIYWQADIFSQLQSSILQFSYNWEKNFLSKFMTEKDFTTYSLGIDLGSTTVKYVLLTSQGEILDRAYVRHQSAVIPTLIKILEDLALKHPNTLVKVSLTGSSALALCEAIQVTFVQEVIAASSFLKHLKEGVDVSIELGVENGFGNVLTTYALI